MSHDSLSSPDNSRPKANTISVEIFTVCIFRGQAFDQEFCLKFHG